MITIGGENAIGRTLADNLGTHIAVGLGSAAPTAGDKELSFEAYRAPIRARSYDPTTDTIVFTATLPDNLELFVNEIALITSSTDADSTLVTTFDAADEEWSGGTFTTANSRYGSDALNVALTTATSYTDTRAAFSEALASDVIQIAYFGAGGTVTVRFNNTDEDYHALTFPALAGYNVAKIPVGSMTKTGVPHLPSANGITVIHSGSGSVTMDAIRISHPVDDEVMIMRQVLPEPYRKPVGMPFDIEFPMEVTR